MVGRRRRSRQRGTFISALYVEILRCAQLPSLAVLRAPRLCIIVSQTLGSLASTIWLLCLLLRDVCPPPDLEVSDILSPKRI